MFYGDSKIFSQFTDVAHERESSIQLISLFGGNFLP